MKSRLLGVLALTILATVGVATAASGTVASEATHGGRPLHATLFPKNQSPPTASNGSGTALVTLNQGQREVCFDVSVRNLTSPVILAHIHQGAAGVNGPVVVDFVEPTNGLNGCVHADAALIKQIRHHPGNYYVNVHTTMFPAGEVRGQLG